MKTWLSGQARAVGNIQGLVVVMRCSSRSLMLDMRGMPCSSPAGHTRARHKQHHSVPSHTEPLGSCAGISPPFSSSALPLLSPTLPITLHPLLTPLAEDIQNSLPNSSLHISRCSEGLSGGKPGCVMAQTNPALNIPCNTGTSAPACRDRSEQSTTLGGQLACFHQALAFLVCLEY